MLVSKMNDLKMNENEWILSALGRRITLISNEPRETNYLFQRVSVLIQRYNAVAFRGSFEEAETES